MKSEELSDEARIAANRAMGMNTEGIIDAYTNVVDETAPTIASLTEQLVAERQKNKELSTLLVKVNTLYDKAKRRKERS